MKVTFNLAFKDRTSCKEMTVEKAETLNDLLLLLCERFGDGFRMSVFDDSRLSSNVLILVNGRSANNLKRLETRLAADDVIDIFPSLKGG